ncbi:MAG TPA: DegT/DnrJ/EryC1/StrS aminotransferase family protein [Solirubrobacteraceae bacterium]|nr:DegT/DnrJ/EryC1/StrS aminotransferase family protein [Solirubrobacteraceae bacterium]
MTRPLIPLARDHIEEADVLEVLSCLRGGWLTMGPRTAELELALARWLAVSHAVALSTGTAAFLLACRTVAIAGGEVIVPALARAAVAQAVNAAGGHLVLADVVSPEEPILDHRDVERRITRRTRAVVVSHPWGYPADATALRALCDANGLALIEDATAALGAVLADDPRAVGTIGEVGCFSLASGRQVGVGAGGVLVSDDEAITDRARTLRSHALTSTTWERHRGHAETYDVVDIGFNFRIDEPRAVLALAHLPRLEGEVQARRTADGRYREHLRSVPKLAPCFDEGRGDRASPLAFPLLARDATARIAVADRLARDGVLTGRGCTLRPPSHSAAAPPAAAETAARLLVLPLHPWSDPAEQDVILSALRQATTS